jgi:hypothetical protein
MSLILHCAATHPGVDVTGFDERGQFSVDPTQSVQIGRGIDNAIQIRNAFIAGQRSTCGISRSRNGEWLVHAYHPPGWVLVNQQPVIFNHPTRLRNGDTISIMARGALDPGVKKEDWFDCLTMSVAGADT